jgi:2',3'-cyclic-nucleotide 2'-phosphodiesterase / 3'-nucleotidase / 5'-nucleotidase
LTGFISKSKRWISLAVIIMMLAAAVVPSGWTGRAAADGAAETVAGWEFASAAELKAASGNALNKDTSIFSFSGSRTLNYTPGNKTVYTNGWDAANGYWQIKINTTGYNQLSLSSKNYGTSTGPKDFKIQYSTDGVSYVDVPDGTFEQKSAIGPGPSELALPSAAGNQPELYIRWVNYTSVSIGGGTVASGGNSRIADIVVAGVPDGTGPKVVSPVTPSPAPNAWPIGTTVTLGTDTVGAAVYAEVNTAGGTGSGYQPYVAPIVLQEPVTIRTYASASGYADSPEKTYDYSILDKTGILTARGADKGRNVWTEGVVTHISGRETYIQDQDAGIVLYDFPAFAEAGDRVEVQGVMDIYSNLQELKPVTGLTYKVTEPKAGVPKPLQITADKLSAANGEQYEGRLVYLDHVDVTGKAGTTITASQNGETFTIYSGSAKLDVGTSFERITGVVKQFGNLYELIPLGDHTIVEKLLSVTAVPGPGRIIAGSQVVLSSPADSAAIYYTVNGADPTAADSKYTAPFTIQTDTTIKAVAVAGGQTSGVYTFAYKISEQPRIHDIQGTSHTSEFKDQAVTDVEGVVTQYGYYFDSGAYKGFFMQDPQPDGDDRTSEGIFVYSTSEALKPAIGDLVKVSGTVGEYNEGDSGNLTSTQISMSTRSIVSPKYSLPEPVLLGKGGRAIPSSIVDNDGLADFQPEEDAADFYESLEGMLVRLPAPTILSPYWTSGGTAVYNIPVRVENNIPDILTPAGGLVLKEADNLNPQRLLLAYGNPGGEVSTGDSFTQDVTGVIGYNYGNYKVIPASGALSAIKDGSFQRETTTLEPREDKLLIASYNIENFHKGVPASKLSQLADSIVNNLKKPDIIGLVEVQDNNGETNDGTVEADLNGKALTDAITAKGGPAYIYTDIAPVNNQDGGAPGGNIRVAFLYNPARVTLAGSVSGVKGTATEAVAYQAAVDKLTVNPGRIDPNNTAFNSSRKPLAAQFDFKGEKIIVIANHFNSKSGDKGPFGQTQPPVLSSETQRHQIAAVVNGFVKEIVLANPAAKVVALGDLNDFQFTPTVAKIAGGEMVDLISTLPLQERYTYTYDGNSQALDHILVSDNLVRASKADVVHLNADFSPSKGRVSDHDAVLAQIDIAGPAGFPLTVLHTNDTHANLDTTSAPDNILRRVTAIQDAKASSANPLLLDAGDVFSGTLYFNKYEGQADLEFMNLAGYDAMTFGNHEFDKGPQTLESFIKKAGFPFVSSNVNFSKDAVLKDYFKNEAGQPGAPGQIYPALVMEVGGEKVGLFGLTTEDTANISSPGDVTFENATEKAAASVAMLQAQGINKIIAVSHLGYDKDLELAKQVEGIDIIVGGHTHTKLDEAVVDRTHSAPKLIVQTGEKGQFLGKLEAVFDTGGVLTAWDETLISVDAKNADGSYVIPAHSKAKAIFDSKYKPGIEELKKQTVGQTAVDLNGVRADVRTKETNLGNLIADGMLHAARAAGTNAVMALQNGGGIRASIGKGTVTQGGVLEVLPYNNDLVTITLTGREIVEALENGVSKLPAQDGRFPHVAGMRFTYDSSKPENSRIEQVEVKNGNAYTPLDLDASYELATNVFTAKGGDYYASFGRAYLDGRVNLLYLPDYQVFTDYLKHLGTVTADSSPVEGRIVDVKDNPSGDTVKLQLLSVNDLHGKINDSYSEASLKVDLNGDGILSANVLAGGMDYMAYAIQQRRLSNPNTLLLHVGDMVGGSPPVSALFQDEPVIEIMEAMGFDAGVVGNHEFDEGTGELLRLVNGGAHPKGSPDYDGQNFPLLAANVVYKDSGKHVLDPYTVKTVEGIKVGFLGVITEETPDIVIPAGIQDIRFTDPAEAVNEAVAELKQQGVKAIVVLAHIPASGTGSGVSGDAVELANAVDDEVDVIYAAHNHLLVNGEADGKLIVQAWEYGKAFSDVDLELDRTTGDIVKKKAELVYNVQSSYDPEVRSIIEHYTTKAAPYMNEVVGVSSVAMVKDYPGMGIGVNGDRALGSLIADGMKAEMNADFALMNGGGVRENLNAGEITWGELFSIQPFNNVLVQLEVTGADLKAIMEAQLGSRSQYGPDFHVSGFTYTWYRDAHDDRKIAEILLPDGQPLDMEHTYTVVVNNFMHTSTAPKNAEIGKRGKKPYTGPEDLEATVRFVKSFQEAVNYTPEGRIREVAIPDLETPVWPEDKLLTASGVTSSSVRLTWTQAADHTGVAGYKVFNGANEVATVTGAVYSYQVTGLSSSTGYTFKVEAVNAAGNMTTNGPSVKVVTASSGSSSYNPGTNTGNGAVITPVATDGGAVLTPSASDLKHETADDGTKMTTLQISSGSLAKAVELAAGGKTVIPLPGVEDKVKVTLPLSGLTGAGEKNSGIIQIRTETASYDLPLEVLKLEALTASLGADASAVSIQITFGGAAAKEQEAIKTWALGNGAALLGDGIGFTVTATAGGKSVEINGFGAVYVSRTLVLDGEIDWRSATAVVLNESDGTLSFVPAVFETSAGKTFVTIKRNSNSVYAVLKSSLSFTDLKGHWSQQDVELLASKRVVEGQAASQFAPDARITRAEFAALLVRALGLKPDAADAKAIKDVNGSEWYAGALGAAVKAGLLDGFEDGTFRPEARISRAEMAVMISRALSAAGKSVPGAGASSASFADGSQIPSWASDAVSKSATAGIIEGVGANSFAPLQQASRAEAAVMLKRLLQFVEFMNK